MKNEKKRIVVLTGAGISAESGLHTFRDKGGLWDEFPIKDVATPDAWEKDKAKVLHFYNLRREQVREAKPNKAHYALTELESDFIVDIVTQNVDDLHERAGSENILHLHGEIKKSRSTVNQHLLYQLDQKDIHIGDKCEEGSQLRPHIVWFGEAVPEINNAKKLIEQADCLIIIGTSLEVYPAADLLYFLRGGKPIFLIVPEMNHIPDGVTFYQGIATDQVPIIVKQLLNDISLANIK